MNLLDKVNNEPPHFANEIIEPLTDETMTDTKLYAKSHYWSCNDSINVQDVKGTMHLDYSGKSWLNLLQNGKRMLQNLRLLNENPKYYYVPEKKINPSMYFMQVDDKTYITSDGNHRTCIAKFLLYYEGMSVLHGVNMDKYIIDNSFKCASEKLDEIIKTNRLHIASKVNRTLVKRDDTAGWCCDYYNLALDVENYKTGYTRSLTTENILELIAESENPFKIFKENKLFWRR